MRPRRILRIGILALTVAGCAATPPTAPDALPSDPGDAAPSGSGAQGSFVGVGHRASGTVRFSAKNGVARLDFSADFAVTPVPGPFVYVNTTNNANTGAPLRVSALRSNSGEQSYTFQIPAGVRYTFVLVWCDPFNVPVAEAAVPATP